MPAQYRVLLCLWIAYLLNYVDRQMAFSWFALLRQDPGFSETQLGLIGSVFLWVYSLAAPLGGVVSDRVPRRTAIAAALFSWSLATIASGFSRSPAAFLVWRGVVGLTEGFYFPAAAGLIGSIFGEERRARALSVHGMAQFAGIAVGGWLGGWLADHFGWRAASWALGGVGILYFLVLWNVLPSANTAPASRQAAPGWHRAPLSLAVLGLAFSLMCFLLWMIYAWLPDYLRSRFHLDLAGSGLHATLTLQMGSACGLLSGGWFGDRLVRVRAQGRCYVVAAGLMVAAPLAPAIFAAPTIPMVQLAAAGFGFFSGLMLSNVVAGAYQMVPPQRYGLTAGCLTLAGGLAGGIGTLLGGLLDRSVGLSEPIAWFSGVCVLCAVMLALGARRKAIPVRVN